MKSRISLCMIVKNEEEFLSQCLRSVEGITDEVIVVDTGSTDSTKKIAEQFGAVVISHEWHNNFSEARNISLDRASGDWILMLDADEELPEETRNKIPDAIDSSDSDGIEMIVRSNMPETDIVRFDESRIVRLFANRKEYRYSMPIHEQIRPSIEKSGGKIVSSDLVIVHHGYSRPNVQGDKNRAERNLGILYDALLRSPEDPYLHYQLGSTLMSAGKRDEAYRELRKVLDMNYLQMGSLVLERFFMKLSQLALEKNENDLALQFAEKCLQYNPANTISKYVVAISNLSMGRIGDGYRMLLSIREDRDVNIKLGIQLDHLIQACRQVLNIG